MHYIINNQFNTYYLVSEIPIFFILLVNIGSLLTNMPKLILRQ